MARKSGTMANIQWVRICINNSLFISVCILRFLPQQKNPRELCWGSSPNFYMFSSSNGNISFLGNEKEWRK